MFHQDIPLSISSAYLLQVCVFSLKYHGIDYSYYQDLYKKYIFSKFQYSIVYPFLLKTYKS